MITLNCTACHGTISRDISLEASSLVEVKFEMSLKCPHCKVTNRLQIITRVEKFVIINGKPLEQGTGEPKPARVRTLSDA